MKYTIQKNKENEYKKKAGTKKKDLTEMKSWEDWIKNIEKELIENRYWNSEIGVRNRISSDIHNQVVLQDSEGSVT